MGGVNKFIRCPASKHPLHISLLDSGLAIQLRDRPSPRACREACIDLATLFDLCGQSAADLRTRPLIVPLLVTVAQLGVSVAMLRERGWVVEVQDRRELAND